MQLVTADWRPEAAVQTTLKMFNLEVLAKNIDLQYERDPSYDGLGPVVLGDEGRFVQCALNLLSNALKFVEASPIRQIRVRLAASPILPDVTLQKLFDPEAFALNDLTPLCEPYAKQWPSDALQAENALLHFAIMDTGPGMRPEEQQKLFKRYSQASPKTYRAFGGVGLGLWISRRLVELHGGAVSLQSIEGVGTIFRLYIKVGRKLASAGAPSPGIETALKDPRAFLNTESPLPAAVKIQNRRPRIMVVEGALCPFCCGFAIDARV